MMHCGDTLVKREGCGGRQDGVNPASRAKGGYTIRSATGFDLPTIDPVHDLGRLEKRTAVEAAGVVRMREQLAMVVRVF